MIFGFFSRLSAWWFKRFFIRNWQWQSFSSDYRDKTTISQMEHWNCPIACFFYQESGSQFSLCHGKFGLNELIENGFREMPSKNASIIINTHHHKLHLMLLFRDFASLPILCSSLSFLSHSFIDEDGRGMGKGTGGMHLWRIASQARTLSLAKAWFRR